MTTLDPSPPRRHDLDALRVGAFGLLILYHVGMFYVPWDWHVKSRHILPALEPFMLVVNPWRLSLLFIISGAATAFMSARMSAGALAKSRSARLLVPLLFGMLVVVAPQSWAQVVENRGYTGGFWSFYGRYLSFDHSFGIILPTYNHLWFVAYLWVYTALALLAFRFWPALERGADRLLAGPGLWIWPIVLPALWRALAYGAWGETHIVFADAYGHLQYGSAFLLGLLIARNGGVWARLEQFRWASLGGAVAVAAAGLALHRHDADFTVLGSLMSLVRESYAWLVIAALFGFARRHITGGSPALSLLTEAVFPFYIIHQTAIVLAGHFLRDAALPVAAEAGVIIAITVAACWATYGLALAIPALRLPLGLKPAPKRPEAPAAARIPAEDLA